ncbi:hypothetical protein LMH87_009618 [Akanthomyces muscarius]|uniref:Choline/ethanolamine kinase n=1 Tax=Akanthomyces muscarius TaxID=2231603 RepID=A0A9W8QDV8_AKAMU|nr:hypothetical protein LMH87_009618 [Akanthomyces muscarius]KAJ4153113.1 hypothetical protein LMH87_009618 [Akanthomyces muscarius]
MVTCTQIPVTMPSDGSTLPNSTIHAIIGAILPLEWPSVDPCALLVTHHTGYANTNCVVARPSPLSITPKEPLQVFLKINGELDGEIAVFKHLVPDKHEEAQLCHDYGQSGRGAKMYGFFQTSDGAYGRVDEFLDARTLTPKDVEDEATRADVARAQAAFHALKTRRERKPVAEYYDALTGELARYRGMEKLKRVGQGAGVPVDDVVDYDFVSRIGRIVARLEGMRARKAWCIHDVQYMNTMLRTSTDALAPSPRRVVLIDFEFVLQNYRGVDIGGHFLHKLFQWFDASSKLTGARPYSAEERAHYCRVYAEQWNAETGDGDGGEEVGKEAELGYMLAIAFEVHNMMNYMEGEGEGEEDGMEMEALRMLFGEFVRQYERLGLEE